MITGGYRHKVLRVDLSGRSVTTEPLPAEDVLRKFVGGTGLGVYYLLREAPMDVEATDPRAPLIFMTGPLAGTSVPSSSNWVTICFHFSIPYAVGVGHGHGFWAARLKHAGYEGIIIYGRAERPVYLWIDDDRVEVRDASRYWGLGTRETERLIKAELGDDAQISVACIGPGGEAMMPGGSVKVDRNHGAGKGSPGSVMGSKNLKAIAIRGTGRVPLADPEALWRTARDWQKRLEERPSGVPAGFLYDGGIARNYKKRGGQSHYVAFKNYLDPEGGRRLARNYTEAAARWKVIPKPSYNCPIGCAYDLQITDGPFAGFTASLCGGAEPYEGAAGMVGVDDAAEAAILVDYYDDMGLEVGSLGAIVSAAFEAYDRGLITKDDCGGLELRWGDWEAAMALVGKMIKREGIGAKLATGLKEWARLVGEPAGHVEAFRKMTVHVKGAGIPMHDYRAFQSRLFSFIVAGYGPAHFGGGGAHTLGPGLESVSENLEEALARVDGVRTSSFDKVWNDSLGICMFATHMDNTHETTVEAFRHATGWEDFTSQNAMEAGERIVNALRLIYQKRGFVKQDEFDYGPRYTEAPAVGPAQGRSLDPFVHAMVDKYYRLMGWDIETGYVTPAALARSGLREFAANVR